jgi:hypothetical protein
MSPTSIAMSHGNEGPPSDPPNSDCEIASARLRLSKRLSVPTCASPNAHKRNGLDADLVDTVSSNLSVRPSQRQRLCRDVNMSCCKDDRARTDLLVGIDAAESNSVVDRVALHSFNCRYTTPHREVAVVSAEGLLLGWVSHPPAPTLGARRHARGALQEADGWRGPRLHGSPGRWPNRPSCIRARPQKALHRSLAQPCDCRRRWTTPESQHSPSKFPDVFHCDVDVEKFARHRRDCSRPLMVRNYTGFLLLLRMTQSTSQFRHDTMNRRVAVTPRVAMPPPVADAHRRR